MQGCKQRYPYPRRECGPCLSSPVRLRPCCQGSPSVSQNKTVLAAPLRPGWLSTTPSAPLVDSPHHHTHTGAVLLTSRILRRRAVSVRSFSVVHSLILGVLASPSAPAAALPPTTSTSNHRIRSLPLALAAPKTQFSAYIVCTSISTLQSAC